MRGARPAFIGMIGAAIVASSLPMTAQTAAPADTSKPVPAFSSARTPTSPAFTLFGLEPSSVERPANPSDLAIAFLSKGADVSAVPNNFALEASPYWLLTRPSLKWSDDDKRSIAQSIARTGSFSIATGDIGTKDAPVRALAFGGRASLLSGRLTAETKEQIARLEQMLTAESALGLRLMAPQLQELTKLLLAGKITPTQHTDLMAALQKATIGSKQYLESVERKAVEKLMQKFATVRNGWFLEIAGAAGWRFTDAVWAEGSFDRWGVWATPSYVGANASVIGVLRYLSQDTAAGTEEPVLDYGLRGVHFRDRYAVSLEYMRRTFKAETLTAGHRLVGIAEYAVTDSTWLVVTFGRDRDAKREGSLLASLSLSFDFNQKRFITP